MTARFVLNIRVLTGMNVQQFAVLAKPRTLQIKPGAFGQGNEISIEDAQGEQRVWFAAELCGLYFEEH